MIKLEKYSKIQFIRKFHNSATKNSPFSTEPSSKFGCSLSMADSSIENNMVSSAVDLQPKMPDSGWLHRAKTAPFDGCLYTLILKHQKIIPKFPEFRTSKQRPAPDAWTGTVPPPPDPHRASGQARWRTWGRWGRTCSPGWCRWCAKSARQTGVGRTRGNRRTGRPGRSAQLVCRFGGSIFDVNRT